MSIDIRAIRNGLPVPKTDGERKVCAGIEAMCDEIKLLRALAEKRAGLEAIADEARERLVAENARLTKALADAQAENDRYRKGFKLLWEMAEDYKTPWVNETLRYNPYFACLFEELKVRP